MKTLTLLLFINYKNHCFKAIIEALNVLVSFLVFLFSLYCLYKKYITLSSSLQAPNAFICVKKCKAYDIFIFNVPLWERILSSMVLLVVSSMKSRVSRVFIGLYLSSFSVPNYCSFVFFIWLLGSCKDFIAFLPLPPYVVVCVALVTVT